MTTPKQSWEERFDEKFLHKDTCSSLSSDLAPCYCGVDETKSFISESIKEAEERGYKQCWQEFKDMDPFKLGQESVVNDLLAMGDVRVRIEDIKAYAKSKGIKL